MLKLLHTIQAASLLRGAVHHSLHTTLLSVRSVCALACYHWRAGASGSALPITEASATNDKIETARRCMKCASIHPATVPSKKNPVRARRGATHLPIAVREIKLDIR